MDSRTALRLCATSGVTLVGAGLLAAVPAAPAAASPQFRAVALAAGQDVGLVVGGTGTPIPSQDYIDGANAYIQRILPGAVSQGVFTPEGGSPIYTGVKSLPFDQSFAQGTTILTSDIENQVAAGNTVAVFGESQSSTISGMVMPNLEKDGVAADAVKFVLVGDPSNPDGGLLERFDGLSLPSLGITFSGATPPDTIYDTTIYTQEYDGFADFPKYTLNFLADLNAFLGIEYVHPTYRDLTPDQINNAILLPTTAGYDGNTTYYMVPMADDQVLPLLRPFEGLLGKPVVDLLNPVLTQIVNLGYDNPDNNGWDVGQANVPTTFGLFPSSAQLATAMNNMGPALQEGWSAFLNDLEHPTTTTASSSIGDLLSGSTPSFTDIVNGLTSAFSQAYSVLLPTADIGTALTFNLPAYDATLFADNIASNPLDAFGLPLAADTGLMTLALGIEYMVLQETASSISSTLGDLFGTAG
ncbi:PE-PPE domain-containing protein [[Mycobacterium] zoologicum]|uniref:PE-PPE domain-containing protein n=1 Tax=[Mycobacterium] zoologicum TaxID=2872311 RepID=UPI001CDB0FAA|nr:PE-PPE domain-containing protein [Mycolicibacter sp. MYC101]MEB3063177.1 PE-PPE domain-containing protein [Mycolicibacter sp. MYC101]